MGALSAVFWGLLVLSLLVFAHEGGHFLAARLFGVRVTEFFLGLPSKWRLSTKSKSYGTEFGVTPFLLGGYNRICGMEGAEDERLADVFACVQRHGRVKVEQLAAELSMEVDDAYALLATLDDWAAVKPYYDEALGEHEGQSLWPEAFETRARDVQGLTEFDKGHDFTMAGSTAAGEPRVLEGGKDAALARERERTYLGKGFLQRICMLLAGPAVNIVLAVIIVVFSLSVGAYCSETIRAAIESIPRGQMEACYCVGMTFWQGMTRVVIPQAMRAAFPPLSNSLIGLVKDTSLAYSVAVVEILATAQRIAARTYDYFWLYCEAGLIYLIFSTVLTYVQRAIERRMERRH